MSYTPTNWKDGDLVTSAKLNKIENYLVEIAESDNSEFVIPIFTYNDDGELVCNMTVDELSTAIQNGKKCLGCLYNYEGDSLNFYILHGSSDTNYSFSQRNAFISFLKQNGNDIITFNETETDPLFIQIYTRSTNNTQYMVEPFFKIDQAIWNYRNIIITEGSTFYYPLKIDSSNRNIYLVKYDFNGDSPSPVYVTYHAATYDSQPELVNN